LNLEYNHFGQQDNYIQIIIYILYILCVYAYVRVYKYIISNILQVESFLNFVSEQARFYRTKNVILTMGGDFTYLYADMYFKSMDKLIRYIKKKVI
jgi:hypothetical protein